MPTREEILIEARQIVGDRGTVRDYQCSCHPGGDRFLVLWKNDEVPVCYNLDELRENPHG